ncbi:hypothetical protein TYRP_005500 [Tyrophagus putrescentiae]|nr:hypothetical protein TYRP_005500 [Tyrophagus putrescentiae]
MQEDDDGRCFLSDKIGSSSSSINYAQMQLQMIQVYFYKTKSYQNAALQYAPSISIKCKMARALY